MWVDIMIETWSIHIRYTYTVGGEAFHDCNDDLFIMFIILFFFGLPVSSTHTLGLIILEYGNFNGSYLLE